MCTHSSISTSTVLYTFNAMQCEYWSTRTKIKGSKSHPFIASQWTKKGLGLVCDFPHWCQCFDAVGWAAGRASGL